MRVLCRIAIVVAATAMSFASVQAATCPSIETFIAQLGQATAPATLDLSSCSPDFEPDVAKAIVALKTNPALRSAAVAALRDGHRKMGWAGPYERLAREIKKLDSSFQTASDGSDRYAALDALIIAPPAAPAQAPAPLPTKAETAAVSERALQTLVSSFNDALAASGRQHETLLRRQIGTAAAVILASLLIAASQVQERKRRKEADARNQQTLGAITSELRSVASFVSINLDKLEKQAQTNTEQLSARFPNGGSIATNHDLTALRGELEQLRKALPENHPPAIGSESRQDQLRLERQIVRAAWRQFCDNKELYSLLRNGNDENWKQIRMSLLRELPTCAPEALKPSLRGTLAAAADFDYVVTKIGLIKKMAEDDLPPLDTDEAELMRTRELAQLLMGTQMSNLTERLSFRLERWVMDTFLGFADLYLQHYQEARLERRHQTLEEGNRIVRDVLRVAKVEPIDVVLGQTPFDSTHHVGRSSGSDSRFPDGTIIGVIRNGFVQAGEGVIRQPEVIVNRVR